MVAGKDRRAVLRNSVIQRTLVGVAGRYEGLIEDIRQVNRRKPASRPVQNPVLERLETIGRSTFGAAEDISVFLQMLGALGSASLGVLRRPRSLRLKSLVYHLHQVGWQAIPIMALVTFLIGAIIAQQGIFHFRKFGAESYVVDLVGILVLREIGVLIVAIMVAGRSGSAYTAELGSMKMREEIDALVDHGPRSCRGADTSAHHCAGPGASYPGLHRLDGRLVWRRSGRVVLWRDESGDITSRGFMKPCP